jgi:hypothetical protein
MNIQKKIVRLMTFKSYLEHTEPIFRELGILDIFKINDYLTAMFMFRYHHLTNLPEVFENYFVTNNQIINTTREMRQNSISVIREQTM